MVNHTLPSPAPFLSWLSTISCFVFYLPPFWVMICSSCPLHLMILLLFTYFLSSPSATQTPRYPPQPAQWSLAGASQAEFVVLSAALLPLCVLPFLIGHDGLQVHADPGQVKVYISVGTLTLFDICVLLFGRE